jgi:hypothetical protein
MMRRREPTDYQGWLNELNNQTKEADIGRCCMEAAKRAPNKQVAFHDLCLVLAGMYERQIKVSAGSPIAGQDITSRFNRVCGGLFKPSANKSSLDKLLEHVNRNEPNFNREAHKVSLGFVKQNKAGGLGFLQD